MGLFGNLFKIFYRTAAIQAKEYALSSDLSEIEKQLIVLLGVEPYEYVSERHILLIGLVRHTFSYAESNNPKKEITLALHFFLRIIDDYFSKIPTISPEAAHNLIHRYWIAEPEDLCKTFISHVTCGRLNETDAPKIPRFHEVMEGYLRDTLSFVSEKISKLEPC